MDGDPAIDSELDTFSLCLPLPYRIAVIFVLGMNKLCALPFSSSVRLIYFRSLGLGPQSSLLNSRENSMFDLIQMMEGNTESY